MHVVRKDALSEVVKEAGEEKREVVGVARQGKAGEGRGGRGRDRRDEGRDRVRVPQGCWKE